MDEVDGKKGRDGSPKEMEILDTMDENPERGNWTGKLDFLLSCLGYAVGLGNVWRFPYLCFKHGGGAFLIPYVIMLFIVGIPLFLLELTMGQYSAMGPVISYSNISPLFKGLGFANFLTQSVQGIYYNMIIAWTIYYLFASFTSKLPWEDCNNEYNTAHCFSIKDYQNCVNFRKENHSVPNVDGGNNIIYHNGTCIYEQDDLDQIKANLSYFYGCTYKKPIPTDTDDVCSAVVEYSSHPGVYVNENECVNVSRASEIQELFDIPFGIRKTAADEYLRYVVLKETDGIENMGPPEWHLVLSLLAAWIVIFLCLIKGIKSSGKVVYFTATFPYAILLILLVRAATLPGAYKGIQFYMVPDWSRLSDIKVWEGAAVQIFFSLSLAGGGLITLASYNKFHNNVIRDTLIVCFGNCLTSVFAGFAIFSVLGFLATELGVEVSDVAQSGSGLAFVAYPDLVTKMVGAPAWAILFFAMLFTLGLDSQFAIVETILTGILDLMPHLRRKKAYVVGAVCFIGFILGLPLTTGGGGYLLDMLDYYAIGWPFLFIGFCEMMIISYVYGIQNYLDDLYHLVKFKPGILTKSNFVVLYSCLSPLLILVVLLFSWIYYSPLTRGSYIYPEWSTAIGWIIAMTSILSVPFMAIFEFSKKFYEKKDVSNFRERCSRSIEELIYPTKEWRANALRARKNEGEMVTNGNTNYSFTRDYDNLGMSTMDEKF